MTLPPFSIYKIYGRSMLPTLKPGDKVLIFNWFINPKIDDLVVVKINGKNVIKRIHDKKNDKLFLKGDNKKASTDSHTYGWIHKSALLGKVIYILKP